MKTKHAKAIAARIRVIAVNTTHVILIDQERGDKPNELYCARAQLVEEIEKAEREIAVLLAQND